MTEHPIGGLAAALATALAELLPDGVGSAVQELDDAGPLPAAGAEIGDTGQLHNAGAGLLGDEAALVAGAGPARRASFTAGRRCARAALEAVGCPAQPILRAPLGAPLWPAGFTGSIAHHGRFAAALAQPAGAPGETFARDLVARPDLAVFARIAPQFASAAELGSLGIL